MWKFTELSKKPQALPKFENDTEVLSFEDLEQQGKRSKKPNLT